MTRQAHEVKLSNVERGYKEGTDGRRKSIGTSTSQGSLGIRSTSSENQCSEAHTNSVEFRIKLSTAAARSVASTLHSSSKMKYIHSQESLEIPEGGTTISTLLFHDVEISG